MHDAMRLVKKDLLWRSDGSADLGLVADTPNSASDYHNLVLNKAAPGSTFDATGAKSDYRGAQLNFIDVQDTDYFQLYAHFRMTQGTVAGGAANTWAANPLVVMCHGMTLSENDEPDAALQFPIVTGNVAVMNTAGSIPLTNCDWASPQTQGAAVGDIDLADGNPANAEVVANFLYAPVGAGALQTGPRTITQVFLGARPATTVITGLPAVSGFNRLAINLSYQFTVTDGTTAITVAPRAVGSIFGMHYRLKTT